jgi:glutamyl-tRNA reductase
VSVILVGLNHQTAPVALREQLSLSGCALDLVLTDLNAIMSGSEHPAGRAPFRGIHESVILSTCNRLEVYAVTGDVAAGYAAIQRFLVGLQSLPFEELLPYLYFREGEEAVEHLMRVAAGLDSLILGEPQILGQVAQALTQAQAGGTAGPVLSQLFAHAVHTGKRARCETEISRHTTSVSHAAARLARDAFGDLCEGRVLIVGAGETAELVAGAMVAEGARRITCINRSYERAERLAQQFGGRAAHWGHLADALAESDVIITATGAPHTVIHRDDVAQALPRRHGKPLVIVDVAVPRDVEPEVGELPGVLRFDIDDLQDTVDANRAQREAVVPQVEAIVQQEVEGFFSWMHGRQVVPVLIELRRKAQSVASAEVEHALRRLEHPDPRTEQLMALLAHRIVGKLLHEPTVRLKNEAANGNGIVYADALRELFALEPAGEGSFPAPDEGAPYARCE